MRNNKLKIFLSCIFLGKSIKTAANDPITSCDVQSVINNTNNSDFQKESDINKSQPKNAPINEAFSNLTERLQQQIAKINHLDFFNSKQLELTDDLAPILTKLQLNKDDEDNSSLFHLLQDQFKHSLKDCTLTLKDSDLAQLKSLTSNLDCSEKTLHHLNTLYEKSFSLHLFLQQCQEIKEFIEQCDDLSLTNPAIYKMLNKIRKIFHLVKIDDSLHQITNEIIPIFLMINDLLSGLLFKTIYEFEVKDNSQYHAFQFWKKNFTPLTASGILSLKNTLMFDNFKLHENDIIDNYSTSFHNWYMTTYKISGIVKKMSIFEQNSVMHILNLQKEINIKMLAVFTHNYKTKTILTFQDCTHASSLLYKLKLICATLESIEPSKQHIRHTDKQLKDIQFNLYSIFSALYYSKKNSYSPNARFVKNKKKIEIDAFNLLLNERSTKGIYHLSKILLSYLSKTKSFIVKNTADPKDPQNNNLFLIKVKNQSIS